MKPKVLKFNRYSSHSSLTNSKSIDNNDHKYNNNQNNLNDIEKERNIIINNNKNYNHNLNNLNQHNQSINSYEVYQIQNQNSQISNNNNSNNKQNENLLILQKRSFKLKQQSTPKFLSNNNCNSQSHKNNNFKNNTKQNFWTKNTHLYNQNHILALNGNINNIMNNNNNSNTNKNLGCSTSKSKRRVLSSQSKTNYNYNNHNHNQNKLSNQNDIKINSSCNNNNNQQTITSNLYSKLNIILKYQNQTIQEINSLLLNKNTSLNYIQKAFTNLNKHLKQIQEINNKGNNPQISQIIKNHIQYSTSLFNRLLLDYQNVKNHKFINYSNQLSDLKKQYQQLLQNNQTLFQQNYTLNNIHLQKILTSQVCSQVCSKILMDQSLEKNQTFQNIANKILQLSKSASTYNQTSKNYYQIPSINYHRVCLENHQNKQNIGLRSAAIDQFCDKVLNKILLNDKNIQSLKNQAKLNKNSFIIQQLNFIQTHQKILQIIKIMPNSISSLKYLLKKNQNKKQLSSLSKNKGKLINYSPTKSNKKDKNSPNKSSSNKNNKIKFNTLVQKLVQQIIQQTADLKILNLMKSIFMSQIVKNNKYNKGCNIKLDKLLNLLEKVQFFKPCSKNKVQIGEKNNIKIDILSKIRNQDGSMIPGHFLSVLVQQLQHYQNTNKKSLSQHSRIVKDTQVTKDMNNNVLYEQYQNSLSKDSSNLKTFYEKSSISSMKNKRLVNCINLIQSRSIKLRNKNCQSNSRILKRPVQQSNLETINTTSDLNNYNKNLLNLIPCSNKIYRYLSNPIDNFDGNNRNSTIQNTIDNTIQEQQQFVIKCSNITNIDRNQQHSQNNHSNYQKLIKLYKIKVSGVDCIAAMYFYFKQQIQTIKRQLQYQMTKKRSQYSTKNYIEQYLNNNIYLVDSYNYNKSFHEMIKSHLKSVQKYYQQGTKYCDELILSNSQKISLDTLNGLINYAIQPIIVLYLQNQYLRIKSGVIKNGNSKDNSPYRIDTNEDTGVMSYNCSIPNSTSYKVRISKFE